jgi:hypothetical protein
MNCLLGEGVTIMLKQAQMAYYDVAYRPVPPNIVK